MGKVLTSNMNGPDTFAAFCEAAQGSHPDLRFARCAVSDAETPLHAEHGGMRAYWVYEGEGEALLPAGFRTKEGDGRPLPSEYTPEPMDAPFAETLACIEAHIGEIDAAARGTVQSILGRQSRGAYIGDVANDLWKLKHAAKPWSKDGAVTRALLSLFATYRDHGYSIKGQTSWERIMPGDQLITSGTEELHVRGHFSCLSIEKVDRSTSHIPKAMRLRFLKDSSGGCNFDFDPFRRLPLTWYWNLPGETGDGLNFVNSHVVNIAKETSPTHFHPSIARKAPPEIRGQEDDPLVGGRSAELTSEDAGAPQNEIYLVLDPQVYGLHTYGRTAQLLTIPDLRDLRRHETHDLRPGDLVYIPAGTGHRGIDAFVNVITLPGFKPYNEFYIDRDVWDAAQGSVPCNESLFDIKNYTTLEEALAG
ncbi:MAG: hypothetical protein HZB26_05670 [Candidatus Hydrogenedentes bacterium]|nr:hypothetical protein [Candidatus Hydrogenedentota bacterium]